jgi:hypothetical protein
LKNPIEKSKGKILGKIKKSKNPKIKSLSSKIHAKILLKISEIFIIYL